MLWHNLLILLRNFKRNKSSFFINLIGLSTGLACALLIYLWVNDELHIDKFHKNDKHLYQVMQNIPTPNGIMTLNPTPGPLAEALAKEMPEVEHAVSVIPVSFLNQRGILANNDIKFKASGLFVSKDYFNVFSYDLLQGNRNQVLSDKKAIVISEALAQKLFNTTENIIGKTVEWNQQGTDGHYWISGIFKNLPSNSSAQFDILLNYQVFLDKKPDLYLWSNSYPSTFITLREGTNIKHFNQKLAADIKTFNRSTFFIQRYSDKYLFGKYENGVPTGGRVVYVRLFSIIALFILFIACFNFMNLTTANAMKRMKEVGVKKTIGANRVTLMFQYMGEAMFISFLSLTIALLLAELLLPQYNAITGKHLGIVFNLNLILSVLGITLFTGLISGSYPAIYLSGFNPATILKGKMNTSKGELWTRKGLVILQFSISVILIVSVLVIYKQMQLIQTKNLGFNRDHIIYFEKGEINIENNAKSGKNFDDFMLRIKNIPGVVNATNFGHLISKEHGSTTGVYWEGKSPDDQTSFANLNVGYDFIETLGIEMKEGRTFSRDFGAEKSTIIFNETAIKQMGLKNPVGKNVNLWGENRQIIGVTKDFNFESLYQSSAKPLFFNFTMDQSASQIMVKLKAVTERATIERLEKFYKEYKHGLPLEFKFLDDEYQALYASEMRVAVLSRYFAGLAIIISCLGLFGLAAFSAERRRKEVGIRKVLGSSEFGIITLLTSDFTKIVLASLFISLPVSYFITKHWLDSFAYRIDLRVWYFIGAGLITLVVAWITVGVQAIKAALANPVEALRYE
ncbi:MAG: ABC transporter permease [Bacteroidota bacterium]